MLHNLKILSILIITILILGCGGCKLDNKGSDIPEGATLIDEEEYQDLLDQGLIVSISGDEQETQALEEEKQLADDNKIIDDFLLANPEVIDPVPDEPSSDDPTITALHDGNYLHRITLNDGSTKEVITLSQNWMIRSIAEGIQVFPTWENQFKIYKSLYYDIPSDIIRSLGLPDPDEIENQPLEYTKEVIKNLNLNIGDNWARIVATIPFTPEFFSRIYDCSTDIGTDADSDRSGCDVDSTCVFQDYGIYKNYDWKYKYAVTCVKDQANRGSCVAFAIVSSCEYWVNRQHGLRVNLSEQALYNTMKFVWERRDYGDGFVNKFGLETAIDTGYLIPFENRWNYNPSLNRIEYLDADDIVYWYTHSCDNYTEPCSDTTHQCDIVCNGSYSSQCAYVRPSINPYHDGYRLKSDHTIWDLDNVEWSFAQAIIHLALGHPVLIGIPVNKQFDDRDVNGFVHYVSGQTESRGGHALHVVGYIDNSKLGTILENAPDGAGGGYFIVKNSWSNCWGDGGYVYLPYAYIKEYVKDADVLMSIH